MFVCPADRTQSDYWNTRPEGRQAPRIAIVSTPRTGNTWLRRLLDSIYSMPQIVEDNLGAIEWDQIPPRCILQLHWWRDPSLVEKLLEHGFRTITLARHPLDVLISILHFASVHPNTHTWIAGFGGDERGIVGTTPTSRAFLRYARSRRADTLLSASRQWTADPDCITVRYEDLVHDTEAHLTALCNRLEPAPAEAIAAAIAANTMEKQRQLTVNQHCWRAEPNLWRRLLPPRIAKKIAWHHWRVFRALGYRCDADRGLGVDEANANWYSMEFAALKEECRLARTHAMRLERQVAELSDALADARLQVPTPKRPAA